MNAKNAKSLQNITELMLSRYLAANFLLKIRLISGLAEFLSADFRR